MFFAYQFHNSKKSYQGKDVSCLGTAESHLKHNALLLQLTATGQGLNLFHKNNQSHRV